MGKICVIGSLNMDLVINTTRVPVMGETLHGSGFMTAPGGKGANQAVAAARLGGDVTMIGAVGDDMFGSPLVSSLRDNNVDVSNVRVLPETPTGIAVIVVKDGNNFIILDAGANFKITAQNIEMAEDIIKTSDILLLQLEIPQDAVERAIDIAKLYGVRVVLNPAPARNLTDEFLSKIDIITPNETECELITGRVIKTIDDAKAAVEILVKKGVKQVVVTLGGKGVVYNKDGYVMHKTVPSVKVVDTTAAGDSFTGALTVALSRGEKIDTAVDFANVVGTLAVTKRGAQPSLPYLRDVENFEKDNSCVNASCCSR